MKNDQFKSSTYGSIFGGSGEEEGEKEGVIRLQKLVNVYEHNTSSLRKNILAYSSHAAGLRQTIKDNEIATETKLNDKDREVKCLEEAQVISFHRIRNLEAEVKRLRATNTNASPVIPCSCGETKPIEPYKDSESTSILADIIRCKIKKMLGGEFHLKLETLLEAAKILNELKGL